MRATREEAYKLLLDSGITQDLADVDMVNRIADVLEKVIVERVELAAYKGTTQKFIADVKEMKTSIRKLLDGEVVYSWESD